MRIACTATVLLAFTALAGCSGLLNWDGYAGGGGADASTLDAAVGAGDTADATGGGTDGSIPEAAVVDATGGGMVVDAGSDAAVAVEAGPSPYWLLVLNDHPLVYLRLGETLGASTAIDEVDAGPQGAYIGDVTLGVAGAIKGDPNTAVELEGGYVDLGSAASLSFAGTAPFSIEAWVNPTGTASYQDVVTKRDEDPTSGSLNGYILLVGDGSSGYSACVQRFYGGTTAAPMYDSDCSAGGAISGSGYTYVVATYDSSYLRLYVNGLANTAMNPVSSTASLSKTTSDLVIGTDLFNETKSFFSGPVDEVAIYDYALDAGQVSAHWHAGSGL